MLSEKVLHLRIGARFIIKTLFTDQKKKQIEN